VILKLNAKANETDISRLVGRLTAMGLQVAVNRGEPGTSLAVVNGLDATVRPDLFIHLPMVEEVTPFNRKFKLASREFKSQRTVVRVKETAIGEGSFTVIAGPCAIESEAQIQAIAEAVAKAGARVLRGGAFKPRTSPYDFQGLGEKGLKFMRQAADANGLLCVSEAMSPEHVPLVAEHVDIVQIGARNMQNFELLKKAGLCRRPVLLKRGLSATYMEFILAAEYLLSFGNPDVILCERGIRTFETYTRNTLDLNAVPVLKNLTHLPIAVDPSHGTGLRDLIRPLARAAFAVGADALMVEVHTDPDAAVSDSQQTIGTEAFREVMKDLTRLGPALGRPLDAKAAPLSKSGADHLGGRVPT